MEFNDNIIEIIGFSKKFKNNVILEDINLKIKRGKCYGFIGENGSGKTLIFKAICGFIRPSSGYITVKGKKVGSEVDFPEDVGVLIEQPGFLPNYSAYENLEFLANINGKIGEKEIRNALIFVNLDPNERKKLKNYSLGMKQRLGIAQAIMENPQILILDEPLNTLDKDGVKIIKKKLQELKEGGKTILITSHNAQDIQELCDYVFEINDKSLNNIVEG